VRWKDNFVARKSSAGLSQRQESDSLGTVPVPADALWGAQTARALIHFNIGTDKVQPELIHALGIVKKASALVNCDLGKLPEDLCEFIVSAADEVISGRLDDQFPLSIWQSGSGTQSNMNANEVIANRAIQLAGGVVGSKTPIHPNDHVNLSQSSNDTFITAMYIAAAQRLHHDLLPALRSVERAIADKAAAFSSVVKIGRTHLQDAVPLTVGQEMSGWTSLLARDIDRLRLASDGLFDLALGATAVGTGLNSHPEFGARAAAKIAELTGLPFRSHPNRFAALSAHDELVFVSGALSTLAGSLMKIANDIRLLGSGPRCGIGELTLPANEPGSSIMPGKINPTQCEVMTMIAVQIQAAHVAIAFAGSQGHLELNVYRPVMIWNFLHSVRLLQDACHSFVKYLIEGIDLNRERISSFVQNSLMLVTALTPRIGYDKAAKVAEKAYREHLSLRDACTQLGFLTAAQFDEAVRPEAMTHP
jgi:fumarate hydratase class II